MCDSLKFCLLYFSLVLNLVIVNLINQNDALIEIKWNVNSIDLTKVEPFNQTRFHLKN